MVTGFLIGRYICPRTAPLSCSSVSSGISVVSIRTSGIAMSDFNSRSRCLDVSFFIIFPLSSSGFSCRDNACDFSSTFVLGRVHYDNQDEILQTSDHPEALFVSRHTVLDREYFRCKFKGDAALLAVQSALCFVPFESHRGSLLESLSPPKRLPSIHICMYDAACHLQYPHGIEEGPPDRNGQGRRLSEQA